MLPNFPHKLRHLIPIALAARLIQLLDIMGSLCLFALRKRGLVLGCNKVSLEMRIRSFLRRE